MSKLNKTTVYDVAKGLATWIAENANGGLTLVELACESGYFADLNTSEIREQITRDLEAHVVGRLVNLHGWAKVQRLEDGRKATRFLPTVGPNGDSRAARAHWLHPRGRDRVVTHEQSGRCEPTRSKQNIRERWPEAKKGRTA